MTRPRFQQVYVEITNICNLNCPFCVETNRKKDYMSVENFSLILDKIKDYTHSVYLHVKGEPLIHPQFDQIIKTLITKEINTKITTNGTKLAQNSNILLNNPNISKINISLQSMLNQNKSIQDEYFNNLKTFLESVKSTHIYLRCWALDDEENSIIKAYLKSFYPNAELYDGELLDEYIHYSYQEKFDWPSLDLEKVDKTKCLGGKNQLGILVDGSVVLCCLDNNGDTLIGNIFKDSLEDILNSELYQNAVSQMPYFEICQKCTYRTRFKRKGGAV